MNLSYNDFGSRITINVWIGPLQEPLNFSQALLWMHIESHTNASMTNVIKFDQSNDEARTIEFDFYPEALSTAKQLKLSLKMTTNVENPIAFKVFIDANPINPHVGVVAAISILIFFNILINAEVNRSSFIISGPKTKQSNKNRN